MLAWYEYAWIWSKSTQSWENTHKIAQNHGKAKLDSNPYFLAFGDQFDILGVYESGETKFSCKN